MTNRRPKEGLKSAQKAKPRSGQPFALKNVARISNSKKYINLTTEIAKKTLTLQYQSFERNGIYDQNGGKPSRERRRTFQKWLRYAGYKKNLPNVMLKND